MRLIDCVQYTPEWWEARKGIPTASAFDRVMTAVKCELSGQAEGYIHELIGDRHNLIPNFFSANRPKNHAMEHGSNWEEEAREWYAFQHDAQVVRAGFVLSDCGRLGCSPDGLVVNDAGEFVGGLELKCPQPATHVGYLTRRTELPAAYRPQVHGQLVVTGLPWIDFCSYCPGFPAVVVRQAPTEYTAKLRACLDKFLARYAEVEGLLSGSPAEAVA